MKGLLSYNENDSKALITAGWNPLNRGQPTSKDTTFNASIPLKFLMGFAEDYQKILINVSQELILVRNRTNDNCNINVDGGRKAPIEIDKIEWHVPHVTVNDETRLQLLSSLRDNKPVYIPLRKWVLYELPALRKTKTDIWPVKASTNLEKPRYVIIGFQNNRKDNFKQDDSICDHSSITNIKLYLNAENYPYNAMNIEMNEKRYVIAYRNYSAFQTSFYFKNATEPLLDYDEFGGNTLFVIDCSNQNESLKSGTIDIKLELECTRSFDPETIVVAYSLILPDNIIQYEPLSGIVRKIV
nr:uncharacterized protein LOC111422202 [Onthophagus taurus]